MPIFEYRCNECNCSFEDLIRNEKDIAALCCPKCGSKNIKKLVSVAGLHKESSDSGSSSSSSSCPSCITRNCSSCS